MQQELWLRAISRVFSSSISSVKPACVLLRAASTSTTTTATSAVPSQLLSRSLVRVTEHSSSSPQLTMSLSNSNHTSAYSMPPARTPNLSRTYNSHHSPSHHHHRGLDNGIKAEFKRSASAENLTAEANPKASRTHQELHKELLLTHKKGLGGLSSRSELHQVMEKKKREKNHRDEEQQTRGVLGQVLLRRQQQQLEKEKQDEDKSRDDAHMSELVRVRQNLRKIHTALNSKASNS